MHRTVCKKLGNDTIWLLLSRFDLGGIERIQVNLAPALAASGLNVRIVAGKFIKNAINIPDEISTLEIAARGRRYFISGLLSALRRDRPSLVITTSNDVACLILLARAWLYPRMKVICTQHLSLSGPASHASHGMERAKINLVNWLMRRLFPKADAIIAVSHAVADDMRHTLGLESRVNVIYNPIILPGFEQQMQTPINWPWVDKSLPTVIFVGRLAKVKRADLLLEAFRSLVAQKPTRLLILGDGPELGQLQYWVAAHSLDSVCYFAGFHANPLPWIRNSDLLVLPSDYEGAPTVLVEAMGCGIQVVSTDCPGGSGEVLGHGRYGQLVPPGDSQALADAMYRSLTGAFHVPSQDLVRKASEFNLERAARRYLSVIRSVCKP